jgi:hypothetical protein
MLLLNGGSDVIPFVLPPTAVAERWRSLTDTADPWQVSRSLRGGERYQLQPRSMAVLKLEGFKEDRRRNQDWGPAGVY